MKNKLSVGVIVPAVALILAALAIPVAAGFFEWSRLGRLAGATGMDPYVSVITPHPTDPTIVYAGTRLTTDNASLVYRSADGGESWSAAGADLPSDLPPFAGVNDLLFLPGVGDVPDRLYAGLGGGGIWLSEDGGAGWEDITGGSITATDSVIALAALPGPAATIYALTSAGVHTSSGGAPWVLLSGGLPAPGAAFFNDLAIDPSDPRILYAATNPLGLFRTADGGMTWAEANGDLPGGGPGLASRNVREVTVNPLTGEVFASLRGSGLFRSADGGATWSLSQDGITYTTTLFGTVGAPVLCPNDPHLAYTFNNDGIFRSEDGGHTWTPFAEGFTGEETISTLAFFHARPNTILAGTSISGVWDLTLARNGRYFIPVVRR